jgi:hypothetical protein
VFLTILVFELIFKVVNEAAGYRLQLGWSASFAHWQFLFCETKKFFEYV